MKRFLTRDRLFYLAVLAVSVLFLIVGNRIAVSGNAYFQSGSRADTYYRSEVIAVTEPERVEAAYDGWTDVHYEQDVTLRIDEGAVRGEVVTVHQQFAEPNDGYKVFFYEVGDRVFAGFNFDSEMEPEWFIADHLREGPMLALVIAFFALIIVFGRFKGFNTVVSLVFTCAAVFFIMIPAIIKGENIYLVTFITATYTIVMTLAIVAGVHPKSVAAAVGCICGVGFAGLLTLAMQDVMYISGLIDEDSSFVMYINADAVIDLRGVIFAAIVIGALGATMDVAMSIASSLDELLYHRPDLSDFELMRSGLNIGRDIIGTMANTLVLAYVGSSLHTILLLLAYNNDLGSIINRENIAVAVPDTPQDRVVAAQAADELLNISGVSASIVLYPTEAGGVVISARSIGDVNVQVLLEGLGGGGNKSAAGAQLQDISLRDAVNRLFRAIDEYLDG